jgi:hypothetical protein
MENLNAYDPYEQTSIYSYANDYYALQHHYNQLLQTTMFNPSNAVNQGNTAYITTLCSDESSKSAYETATSPVPNGGSNFSNETQYTPLTSLTEIHRFYPTPPSDEKFRDTKEKEKQRSSPDVSPLDDSLSEYNSTSKVKRRTRTQFTKYQVRDLRPIHSSRFV